MVAWIIGTRGRVVVRVQRYGSDGSRVSVATRPLRLATGSAVSRPAWIVSHDNDGSRARENKKRSDGLEPSTRSFHGHWARCADDDQLANPDRCEA